MRMRSDMFLALVFASTLICGCGSGGAASSGSNHPTDDAGRSRALDCRFFQLFLAKRRRYRGPWLYDPGLCHSLHDGWLNADKCVANLSGADSGFIESDRQGTCHSERIYRQPRHAQNFTANICFGHAGVER